MFIVDLEELLAPRRREGHVQLHGELAEKRTWKGHERSNGDRKGPFEEIYTPLPLGSKQEKEGGIDRATSGWPGAADESLGCVRAR